MLILKKILENVYIYTSRLNCMALLDQVITPVMLFNYLLLSSPSYAREERNLQFCFLSSIIIFHCILCNWMFARGCCRSAHCSEEVANAFMYKVTTAPHVYESLTSDWYKQLNDLLFFQLVHVFCSLIPAKDRDRQI